MCLFPLRASLPEDGGRAVLNSEGDLKLPCGKCNECISKRALEWATRARHEISLHKENSFITLTYNEDNLPSDFIIKEDFQKFVKRLRKKTNKKIRYMVSYEYGSKKFRPHMHAIFFGYNPPNQQFLKNTPGGNQLTTSTQIDKLWDYGYHSIGDANEKTAYYIASYALKGKSRTIYHPKTGEHCTLNDSMNVSVRPAIGLNYFLKNCEQLVDSKSMLPRYYVKKLEEYVDNPDYPQITAELCEEYQNQLQSVFKDRSSGELYAKYIIDSQKSSLLRSNFREISTDTIEERKKITYKSILKSNRDNYVAYTKG